MTPAEALDELLHLHRAVKFTNVDLGIRDADVCFTCHSRMDRPICLDYSVDGPFPDDWTYPLVQDPYPCRTRQLLETLLEARP